MKKKMDFSKLKKIHVELPGERDDDGENNFEKTVYIMPEPSKKHMVVSASGGVTLSALVTLIYNTIVSNGGTSANNNTNPESLTSPHNVERLDRRSISNRERIELLEKGIIQIQGSFEKHASVQSEQFKNLLEIVNDNKSDLKDIKRDIRDFLVSKNHN